MSMRQFLWFYLRAWWWTHVPEGPRFHPALWGWLGLGTVCALSLRFGPEIWPHTPAAGSWAAAGLGLAGVASFGLVGWGLGRWLAVVVRHHRGWQKLALLGVLLVGGGALLAGLGLAVAGGLAVFLLSRLDWPGFRG